MMFAIFDKIEKGKITPSDKILCIHTGGLQGWSGWHYRFPQK
jgi:1-aminocyclopropane-1-carboxylate deaminase